MKLFIVAALISAASAARLEHLERGYLPPAQNNYAANAGGSSFPTASAHGNFGFGNQASQYSAPGRGSNGFGSNGVGSNGFGSNSGHGLNGFGASARGSNGLGGNSAGSSYYGANGASGRNGGSPATSNQYLPPNYGSHGDSTFESIRPACSSCGSSTFGSPQRYQQQGSTSGSQSLSIPSTQYGSPQSFIPPSTFESQPSYTAQQQESTGVNRQYLAPKPSGHQNGPQQPFDENTGYIY